MAFRFHKNIPYVETSSWWSSLQRPTWWPPSKIFVQRATSNQEFTLLASEMVILLLQPLASYYAHLQTPFVLEPLSITRSMPRYELIQWLCQIPCPEDQVESPALQLEHCTTFSSNPCSTGLTFCYSYTPAFKCVYLLVALFKRFLCVLHLLHMFCVVLVLHMQFWATVCVCVVVYVKWNSALVPVHERWQKPKT